MSTHDITITADALRDLLHGTPVTLQSGGSVIALRPDPDLTLDDVEAALDAEARAYLAEPRSRPRGAVPTDVRAFRGARAAEKSARWRGRREEETGYQHARWQHGGAWMVGPKLPPEATEGDG